MAVNFFRPGSLVKLARALAFLGFVGALSIGFFYKRARAKIEFRLVSAGEELMRYPGARNSEPRDFFFNGAKIMVRTAIVEQNTAAVLDHYEEACRARDGSFAKKAFALGVDQVMDVAKLSQSEKLPGGDADALDMTMRFGGDDGGVVTCIDTGQEPLGFDDLLARLREFAETGDLSRFGGVRYLYARAFKDNGVDKTHMVTVWNDDSSLNIFEMFPENGDAPGSDIDGLPRPSRSQRTVSAWERGRPYGMTQYRLPKASAEEMFVRYTATLAEQGWRLHTSGPDTDRWVVDGARVAVIEQGNRMATLISDQSGQDTYITLLPADWKQ